MAGLLSFSGRVDAPGENVCGNALWQMETASSRFSMRLSNGREPQVKQRRLSASTPALGVMSSNALDHSRTHRIR
jgi:hypothetical protein